MSELSSAQERVLKAFPPGSRCWTCGGPNSAHRIMDEIRGRHEAGDSARRLAEEFGKPKIAINCLLRMSEKDYEAMLLASALPEHEEVD